MALIGTAGKLSLYVVRKADDPPSSDAVFTDYSDYIISWTTKGTINQLSYFEATLASIETSAEKLDISKGNLVYLMAGTKLIGKFIIGKPDYRTDFTVKISGYQSSGTEMVNRKLANESMPKITYDSRSACYILNSTCNTCQGILVDGAENTILALNPSCYGTTCPYSVKYDYENRITAVDKLIHKTGQEWWVDHGTNDTTPYSEGDYLNVSNRQGGTAPSSYDVTYTFPDITTAEIGWDYVGPDHNGLQVRNTAGAWCWTSTGTPSSDTGPPSGIPCVYTETSSPVSVNDVFTMTLTDPVSAATYNLYVTFDRCTYGNTSAHLYFEAWDGSTWQPIADWAGDSTTTFTSEGPYDFTSYTNADFKIRFRTVVGGTTFTNDMAVDTVRIYGESPKTFYFAGANQNAIISEGAEELETNANHVVMQGQDQRNVQVESIAYDSTGSYTCITNGKAIDGWLSSNITASGTVIPLTSGSVGGVCDQLATYWAEFRIDDELIKATTIVGDPPTLTDVTRGFRNTEATPHREGADVVLWELGTGVCNPWVNMRLCIDCPSCLIAPSCARIGTEVVCVKNLCEANNYVCIERLNWEQLYAHGEDIWVKEASWDESNPDNRVYLNSWPSFCCESSIIGCTSGSTGIITAIDGTDMYIDLCDISGNFCCGETICQTSPTQVAAATCREYITNSIQQNGLFSKTFSDNTARNKNMLDKVAQRILLTKKSPIKRIVIEAAEPIDIWNDINLGDTITLGDGSKIGLSDGDEVRITGFEFSFDGFERLLLYCNDKETRTYPSTDVNYVKEQDQMNQPKQQESIRTFGKQDTVAAGSGTPSSWSEGLKKVKDVLSPSEDFDAANKKYVDACAGGAGLWEDYTDPYICPCGGCYICAPAVRTSGQIWAGTDILATDNVCALGTVMGNSVCAIFNLIGTTVCGDCFVGGNLAHGCVNLACSVCEGGGIWQDFAPTYMKPCDSRSLYPNVINVCDIGANICRWNSGFFNNAVCSGVCMRTGTNCATLCMRTSYLTALTAIISPYACTNCVWADTRVRSPWVCGECTCGTTYVRGGYVCGTTYVCSPGFISAGGNLYAGGDLQVDGDAYVLTNLDVTGHSCSATCLQAPVVCSSNFIGGSLASGCVNLACCSCIGHECWTELPVNVALQPCKSLSIYPKTASICNIGTDLCKWNNGYFNGTIDAENIIVGTNILTGTLSTASWACVGNLCSDTSINGATITTTGQIWAGTDILATNHVCALQKVVGSCFVGGNLAYGCVNLACRSCVDTLWADYTDPYVCPCNLCSVCAPTVKTSGQIWAGTDILATSNVCALGCVTSSKIAGSCFVGGSLSYGCVNKAQIACNACNLWANTTNPYICPCGSCSICAPTMRTSGQIWAGTDVIATNHVCALSKVVGSCFVGGNLAYGCVNVACCVCVGGGSLWTNTTSPWICPIGGCDACADWIDANYDMGAGCDIYAGDDLVAADSVYAGDDVIADDDMRICGNGSCGKLCMRGKDGDMHCLYLCSSNKYATIEYEPNKLAILKVEESPDVWFNDRGIVKLCDGYARICFDCIFRKITEEELYHVQVTPLGAVPNYWIEKGKGYFDIKTQKKDNIKFDWQLSAIRKGMQDLRWKAEKKNVYLNNMNTFESYKSGWDLEKKKNI